MSEPDAMVVCQGWCWVCPKCGQRDAPFAEEAYAQAAADKHRAECES